MAVGLNIKADSKPVRREIERLIDAGVDLTTPLRQIGVDIRRGAQQRLRARRGDFGPSSGRLSKSLTMAVDPRLVRVGSPLVYAAVQQVGTDHLPGGVIRPKHGRYLAIPATTALRRRNVWPRDLPRDSLKFAVTDIAIGKRRWRGPALVDAESGDLMFALVRTVRIKGRPYLVFEAREQAFALRALRLHYVRAIRRRRNR